MEDSNPNIEHKIKHRIEQEIPVKQFFLYELENNMNLILHGKISLIYRNGAIITAIETDN